MGKSKRSRKDANRGSLKTKGGAAAELALDMLLTDELKEQLGWVLAAPDSTHALHCVAFLSTLSLSCSFPVLHLFQGRWRHASSVAWL